MLRRIEYTITPDGILPHSPQFGGVQGESGVTTLEFTPDTSVLAAINGLRESYDSLIYRIDCIDGAGHLVVGEAVEFSGETVGFTLTDAHTCMGGRITVVLVISGVNNDEEKAVEIYSFPAIIYFKEFPVRKDYSERHDLNKAVLQVKRMRDETYDIAAAAFEAHRNSQSVIAEFKTYSENATSQIEANSHLADEAADKAVVSAENAGISAADAASAANTASGYAGSALTSSVQASGYASDALESANIAQKSAENAAESLEALMAVTGDINAVLATVVDGVV